MLTELAASLAGAVIGSKELLQMIYKDLAQPGVQQVGSAVGNILGLGNTILLPIRLLNDRASAALVNNMERYRKSLEDVPIDEIQPVTPEIGVPLLERMTYVTDDAIAEMLIQMLANASQTKHADEAHPAFIHIIDCISPDEVKLLKALRVYAHNPFGTYQIIAPGSQFVVTQKKYLLLAKTLQDAQLTYPEYVAPYVENLKRLGILEPSSQGLHNHDADKAEEIKATYAHLLADEPMREVDGALHWHFGYFYYTDFGRAFKYACRV
jgi:hypothetical protein